MHNKIKIVCDATCRIPNSNIDGRSNRGESAYGILFLDENGSVIQESSYYLGELTPPQAEYTGLVKALDEAAKFGRKNVEVWLDSEFIVRQLNGGYAVKSDNMKPLYDKVKELERRFFGQVRYYHHPRTTKLAKQADDLANKELDSKSASG